MSRTYDHRPSWAQGTLVPHHDHRTGECDLPPLPTSHGEWLASWPVHNPAQRCAWWPGPTTRYSAYKNASNPRYDRAAARRAAARDAEEQRDDH